MKITICGSIAFYKEMLEAKAKLEALGHEVKIPPADINDDDGNLIDVKTYYVMRKQGINDPNSWFWDVKKDCMLEHFKKVSWCDAILVTNLDKNGIKGYIGGNTLMEMGLALHLSKPIFMTNEIPEINYKEEILGMKPVLINDLEEIK